MKTFKFNLFHKKLLADTITPVSLYLKLRDQFPKTILLESSDYHTNHNSFSYLCFNPVAHFEVSQTEIKTQLPDGSKDIFTINNPKNVVEALQRFIGCFEAQPNPYNCVSDGLFGYTTYDAVQFFESVNIHQKSTTNQIPLMQYIFYQNIIAINHFKNEAYVFCLSLSQDHNLSLIENLLSAQQFASFPFYKEGTSQSNLTDDEFRAFVGLGKQHCKRGDVFQLVLSRQFSQNFKGDEFNVYRALRSINPSPYLFYFDYGSFKIFGSSPEAQLVIKNNLAEIHPIAGTFKRTGSDEEDAALAKALITDPKENSEHVMLVDLARNDLSRQCQDVEVKKYKDIQFFSHVIHLVSQVTGKLKNPTQSLQLMADTFPAGTLSGAPKVKAMQLIEAIEPTNRSFYGGAIGYIGLDHSYNHAIMIRSFLSKNHQLIYQAGAGIVESSNENNETQEVYNKLNALKKAIDMAEQIN